MEINMREHFIESEQSCVSPFLVSVPSQESEQSCVSAFLVSVPSQESEQSCVSPRLWFLLFLRFIYWDLTAWYFFHLHIITMVSNEMFSHVYFHLYMFIIIIN
jgi:hypothetical protein